jgi:hypothetical protein
MKMTHDNCLTFKMQNNVSVNPLDNRSTEVVTSSVVYLALLCRRLAPCIYCAPTAGCLALLNKRCLSGSATSSGCCLFCLATINLVDSPSVLSTYLNLLKFIHLPVRGQTQAAFSL